MERFCKAIAKLTVIMAIILALLLIGIGLLIIWNPVLVVKIAVYGIGFGCLAVAGVCLIGLLAAVCFA